MHIARSKCGYYHKGVCIQCSQVLEYVDTLKSLEDDYEIILEKKHREASAEGGEDNPAVFLASEVDSTGPRADGDYTAGPFVGEMEGNINGVEEDIAGEKEHTETRADENNSAGILVGEVDSTRTGASRVDKDASLRERKLMYADKKKSVQTDQFRQDNAKTEDMKKIAAEQGLEFKIPCPTEGDNIIMYFPIEIDI
jgi:hypothetical protein